VVDQTRHLVPGVAVFVNNDQVRLATNREGIFQIDVLPSDSTIGFRRIGYRPLLVTIDPLPPMNDTLLIELQAIPIQLGEVTVSARPTKPLRYAGTTKYDEVFLRHSVGLGTLITNDDIRQRFGLRTYELLGGIPGVQMWNGPPKRIRFARCQDPGGISVFVDGALQLTYDSTMGMGEEPVVEMLSRIDPTDIEMIEVFRGVAEIPGVFHWNGCAVIAVWTRWNK
jgi:hypothetical protein